MERVRHGQWSRFGPSTRSAVAGTHPQRGARRAGRAPARRTLFEGLISARMPGRHVRGEPAPSQTLAAASIESGDVVVNLLDTPGNPDFVGEVRAGLRAADAVLFVVSASDEIDDATRLLWRECETTDMPRAIAVTKLEQSRADFDESIARCRRVFRRCPGPWRTADRGWSRRSVRSTSCVAASPTIEAVSRSHARPDETDAEIIDECCGSPDRVDHRGVRGRDAAGPAPQRRADRFGDRRCPTCAQRWRRRASSRSFRPMLRLEWASKGCTSCSSTGFPSPAAAPTTNGLQAERRGFRRGDLRSGRPARRRGGAYHERPVHRPALLGPGLLRHPAAPTPRCTSRASATVRTAPRRGPPDHDSDDERVGPLSAPFGDETSRSRTRSRVTLSWCPSCQRPRPPTRSPARRGQRSSSRGCCPSRCCR